MPLVMVRFEAVEPPLNHAILWRCVHLLRLQIYATQPRKHAGRDAPEILHQRAPRCGRVQNPVGPSCHIKMRPIMSAQLTSPLIGCPERGHRLVTCKSDQSASKD